MSKPLRMHQIRRIIELKVEGRSIRQIVRLTGLSRNTVKVYLRRIASIGLSLKELLALDEESLSTMVHVSALDKSLGGRSIDNRFEDLKNHLEEYCQELKRRGVTRQLLWEEYRKKYPQGYGYTQFCAYLNQYSRLDEAVMYFTHQPAETSQIDFAGKKLAFIDHSTGEWVECESLVCVLPYSHYLYVEAIRSQKQEHFIPALVRFKKFIGGVTACVKMDNMRTAVQRSNRYEPVFTEAMEYFAAHYGTATITARVGKPRDKGSVEKAVDLAYKHIYAPLRNQQFYSLEELNAGILRQLELFNTRPFKNKPGSRKSVFEQHEKPLLKPLPQVDYEIKRTTDSKVQRNYHVILGEDRHQYSVPYTLIGKRLKIIYTSDTVEIYEGLKRVAIHKRNYQKNGYTTNVDHRPVNHQKVAEQRAWDDEYFLRNASYIGQSVQQVVKRILESRGFYEQTYNSCLGILRLAKQYGNTRLENACHRALGASRVNYGIVENILRNNLDKLVEPSEPNAIPDHDQIRGSKSYQ